MLTQTLQGVGNSAVCYEQRRQRQSVARFIFNMYVGRCIELQRQYTEIVSSISVSLWQLGVATQAMLSLTSSGDAFEAEVWSNRTEKMLAETVLDITHICQTRTANQWGSSLRIISEEGYGVGVSHSSTTCRHKRHRMTKVEPKDDWKRVEVDSEEGCPVFPLKGGMIF